MMPVIIGILSGLLVIFTLGLFNRLDKRVMYGLILAGIGFLYVGFTWSDIISLVINSLQAIFFVLAAYFGIKKSMYYLAAGYFLHGTWDLLYHYMPGSELIPPQYDLFCLSIDFTIGFYLLVIKYRKTNKYLSKSE